LTTKLALLRRAYETSGKKLVEILKSQQNVPLQSNRTRALTFENVCQVESSAFAAFVSEHAHWLKPYALYCVLRDLHGNADSSQWGEMGRLSASHIETLASPGGSKYMACRFWYWVQYHLHQQLLDARLYADAKGVVLMGDLATGLARHSVDVWVRPDLFHHDRFAGAQPDGVLERGQNWNQPVFDWQRMARDGYAWWRGRMRHMATYFSAVRVLDIVGFFRLWELPSHAVTGLGGHFDPARPVSASELDALGLWDRQRLSTPYIRAHLLQRAFGKDWGLVV
jgi:4-alpha-glucanotransferase